MECGVLLATKESMSVRERDKTCRQAAIMLPLALLPFAVASLPPSLRERGARERKEETERAKETHM